MIKEIKFREECADILYCSDCGYFENCPVFDFPEDKNDKRQL